MWSRGSPGGLDTVPNGDCGFGVRQAASVEIRKLGPDDWELLVRAVTTFSEERAVAPDLFLGQPRTHAFVAVDGDDVIGWCYGYEILRPEGRWMMLLPRLDVVSERRPERIGRHLLDAFVALARSKGHDKMWLYTDAGPVAARGLYEGAGGQKEDRRPGPWWVFE
jgi:GNAT superfamily N-acetyltransferase